MADLIMATRVATLSVVATLSAVAISERHRRA
jgi:hypothetical protein